MKCKRTFGIIALILILTLIFTAGCGKKGAGASADDKTGGDSSKNPPGSVSEEDGSSDDEEDESDDSYVYRAKIEDKKSGEGKLSVYFMRGAFTYKDYTSSIPGELSDGESTLIVSPDGTATLMDFNCNVGNASYIVSLISKLGIDKLDNVIVTGPAKENLGGYAIIIDKIPVGQIITGEHEYKGNYLYEKFIADAAAKNIPVKRVAEGDTLALGEGVNAKVLNPPKGYSAWTNEEEWKNGALMLKLTYGNSSFLMGGSIGKDAALSMVAKYGGELKCDVVKMNRQGNGPSNPEEWVNAVDSRIAVAVRGVVEEDTAVADYMIPENNAVTLYTALDGTCAIFTGGDGTYDVQVESRRQIAEFGYLRQLQDGHMTVK